MSSSSSKSLGFFLPHARPPLSFKNQYPLSFFRLLLCRKERQRRGWMATIERSDHTILIDPVGMHTKRDPVFQFESHPVLYGSKPPTNTHETLSSMELPDDMTYCLWLRCWTVSGNSGLSLTSDQSKELRSMEESKHSTSPRSSFVAPHREMVIGLFFLD